MLRLYQSLTLPVQFGILLILMDLITKYQLSKYNFTLDSRNFYGNWEQEQANAAHWHYVLILSFSNF